MRAKTSSKKTGIMAFPSACLIMFLLLASVSCMRTVYVPTLKPAPVHLGSHIQNIAVVDRATPENDTMKVLDVLTASIPNLNREASQKAVDGLVLNLERSPRYNVVRTPERLTTPAVRGNWPPPMGWNEVESLAKKYNSDAIIVLESFNSEFILTDGATRLPPKTEGGGGEILRRQFYVEGIAGIKLGFRIYDLQTKSIADEFMFNHNSRVSAEGNALQMVAGGLIDHRQAVNEASFHSGRIYADRISPQWLRLNREFFTKGRGHRDFKIGVRRATVNDWSGAREAWHRSVDSRRRKTAGRSAYNLALMYEIAGDLDVARDWAQHSYTDFRIRKARDYVYKLDRRIREQRITASQME
jgi:hypothetical protein